MSDWGYRDDESWNNPYPSAGESLREADRRIDAMNEADIEVRAGTCKEHCARALQGQSECESQWDCADPKVVAQCAEDIARERRAEAGPEAYDSRYSGGIDMTDPNDGPDNYYCARG